MKKTVYTKEKNIRILIALMKAHGISRVIVSPGSTNLTFVASIQSDPFFELYSCIDERSAAYMACGMAANDGKPVALSCTGATASRNYMSGLTEAYYRKLPVLAITSTQFWGNLYNCVPQTIDRSSKPNDICRLSVNVPYINEDDVEEKWATEILINRALLELTHRGGGPAHINIETRYSKDYSYYDLPEVKTIKRIEYGDELPELKGKNIAVCVGAHMEWNEGLTKAVDEFCEKYNAVVLCDYMSNYHGAFGVFSNLACRNETVLRDIDILVHIGNVSSYSFNGLRPKVVWRVCQDGNIEDLFKKLTYVFEMQEVDFFIRYSKKKRKKSECLYYKAWAEHYSTIYEKIKEDQIPFSNIYIAKKTIERLKGDIALHLGILNTNRSWNLFAPKSNVKGFCCTGGFGIDGNISSMLGSSFVEKQKLFLGIFGDLAFFYDINSLGNRHVGNNVRIMLINNGIGAEFKLYTNPAARFNELGNEYMAGGGHFANKSPFLVRQYSETLGFEYLSANEKKEFLDKIDYFLDPNLKERPVLFEVFTDYHDESEALKYINRI